MSLKDEYNKCDIASFWYCIVFGCFSLGRAGGKYLGILFILRDELRISD